MLLEFTMRAVLIIIALLLCSITLVTSTPDLPQDDDYSPNSDYSNTLWKEGSYITCNSLAVEQGMTEAGTSTLNISVRVRNDSECTCTCSVSNDSNSILLPPVALATYSITKNNSRRQVREEESRTTPFTGNISCPPGFLLKANASLQDKTQCECTKLFGVVQCARFGEKAFIRGGYCMTHAYDHAELDKLSFGLCALSCQMKWSLLDGLTDFYELPKDVGQLNALMCDEMNRQGFLCSECKPGFMPPAYSYSHKCVNCTISSSQLGLNWVKYFAAVLIPQTVLFLLMLVFRVNVAIPPYSSLIQVFQALTTPALVQEFIRLTNCWDGPRVNMFINIPIGIYGLFNLEFFRLIIPPFCLNLNLLHLQYLEFLSAFFPLFLICCTYILITLHMKSFKPVVFIWKPFHYCLARFRREWNLKSSVIETFASFLILSWIKLLSISYSLLLPIHVYSYSTTHNSSYIKRDTIHLHYYPEVQLFKGQHLPLGILTLLVLLILIIIPLLLLLFYPLKIFQRCLSRCGLRCQALHMFMDAFQGAFKNGTDGTKDYRSVSSIYLLVRIVLLALTTTLGNRFFFPIASIVLIVVAVIITALQPYKKPFHNIFEVILLLIMACFFASVGAVTVAQFATADGSVKPSIGLVFSIALSPLVISIVYLCWWICSQKLKGWVRRSRIGVDETLPDRVTNPQDYMGHIPYNNLNYNETRL